MRYGHQPMSDIERMTLEEISMWAEEIVELIRRENEAGPRSPQED